MSFTVRFAPEVAAQLQAIEDFISRTQATTTAAAFVDAIVSHCENLATFPLRGIRRDDLLPGLRISHYRGRTIIAFTVDTPASVVSILGVYYGGRDYDAVIVGA
ncbi:type II toxin-antitoxin system RelE/ParE family toxin [Pseudoxanthomonas indica]|uniref:Plasmid stabilization system protein ParE n=1 Tax=Pseudoxanthomonas indica TaxID=428993 RepID=A0A1T5KUU0_9GAMM|nr:type II toxin-antitoxin system RelE/ParE family toxin [Pseudoxanthomonas indica]GGD51998.1 hypothetical protein GCM10007235_25270 [Pseudoxanthomonas indica]SKC67546.1 Plasmid stabilization system protein ParE [Pseudoxanthomonas indica]